MRQKLAFLPAIVLSFVPFVFGLSGCGDAPPPLYGDVPVRASGGGGGGTPDMAMVVYPMGPYGNQKDDTLADFTVAGYRLSPEQTDSTKLTWDAAIKLSEFHANPKCKCLLISTGATWCGACQQEQPALISDVQADPSFCVLGVLQEGTQNGTTATMSDVDDWAQHFHQNFYTVLGTSQTKALWKGWAMNGVIGLPFNLIVRTDTMKVVGNVQGFSPTIHDEAMALCSGK